MILVIANELDPHVDAVADIFNQRGINFMRLDLERAHGSHEVRFAHIAGDTEFLISNKFTGRSLSLKDVKAVWWRRGASFILEPRLLPEATVASEETKSILKWAIESLDYSLFPLGHPWSMQIAENKVSQLKTASDIGFNIPEYVFSNNKAYLKSFMDSQSCIIKSLAHSGFKRELQSFALVPKRVTLADLNVVNDQDACAFLQVEVERMTDIRVFVGPGWTHAAEIDLSQLPPGEVDWRMHITKLSLSLYQPDQELEKKCRVFLKRMGLVSGHFDFIIDRKGKAWFLECNPNGQWYWLESMGQCRIAESVAGTLVAHANVTST
jgi:hypothetical protein